MLHVGIRWIFWGVDRQRKYTAEFLYVMGDSYPNCDRDLFWDLDRAVVWVCVYFRQIRVFGGFHPKDAIPPQVGNYSQQRSSSLICSLVYLLIR